MKLKYFLFLLSFLTTVKLFGQIEIGAKAGAGYSDVVFNGAKSKMLDRINTSYRAKLSYQIGAYLNIGLSKRFSVQTELLYANKGYKSPESMNVSKVRVDMHYLSLPVLFVFKPIKKLSVEAGPEFNYLISPRAVSKGHSSNISVLWRRKSDLAALLGIKFSITSAINISARYNMGFTNLLPDVDFRDEYGNSLGEDIKVQNRGFILAVGYSFIK